MTNCIGHSDDDKDDDLCLSKALLHVSDEFYSSSCLCDADSFILVASVRLHVQLQAVAPAGQTHILYNFAQ